MQARAYRIGPVGLIATVLGTAILAWSWPATAQSSEPLLGTWVLAPGNVPAGGDDLRGGEMKFEQIANRIRHTTENVEGWTGGSFQYAFEIDGKDYPADPRMSNPFSRFRTPITTFSFKRIDARTVERTGKYHGEARGTTTYQLSADEKVLTVTERGTRPWSGSRFQIVVRTFNRQPERAPTK